MSPTVGCDTDSSKTEEEDCNGIGVGAAEEEDIAQGSERIGERKADYQTRASEIRPV